MADSKISALSTLATSAIAAGDLIPIVDVSDTSMSGSGTNKVIDANKVAYTNIANTFSALQTFDAGISLGNETLSVYDEGTFDARLMDSSGHTAAVFSSNLGQYTRIGNVVIGTGKFHLSNGTSGLTGSDVAHLTLPLSATSASNYQSVNTVFCQTAGLTNYGQAVFRILGGQQYGTLQYIQTNATPIELIVSQLANVNQTIIYMFMYHV